MVENCLKCCFINTCRILACDFSENNKMKHKIIDEQDNNINEEKNNEISQNILKLVDYESLDKDNKEAYNVWKPRTHIIRTSTMGWCDPTKNSNSATFA